MRMMGLLDVVERMIAGVLLFCALVRRQFPAAMLTPCLFGGTLDEDASHIVNRNAINQRFN